jgi:ketosteroid isomerase-like protein
MADREGFAAAARALDEAFVRYVSMGKVDELIAACYAEDALVLPPNLPLVRGTGQIRELFRELLEACVGEIHRETTPLYVAGDLGYGVGTYTCEMYRLGDVPVRDTGKYMLVYLRQAPGAWKIAVEMFSSDLPAG